MTAAYTEETDQPDLMMAEAHASSDSESSSSSDSSSGSESDSEDDMDDLVLKVEDVVEFHSEDEASHLMEDDTETPLLIEDDVELPPLIEHDTKLTTLIEQKTKSTPLIEHHTNQHQETLVTESLSINHDIEMSPIDHVMESQKMDIESPHTIEHNIGSFNKTKLEGLSTLPSRLMEEDEEEEIEICSPRPTDARSANNELSQMFTRTEVTDAQRKQINFENMFMSEETYEQYTTTRPCFPQFQSTFDTLIELQALRKPLRQGLPKPFSSLKRAPESNEPKKPKPTQLPSVAQSPLDVILNKSNTGGRVLTRAQLQQQQQQKQQTKSTDEPMKDLMVASSAASSSTASSSAASSSQPTQYSRFTKEEHKRFITLSEQIRKNQKISEEDHEFYRHVLRCVDEEKPLFIKAQCAEAVNSGVYEYLDRHIARYFELYYRSELERLEQYPQHYAFFNLIPMKAQAPMEKSILSYKKHLSSTGWILGCIEKPNLPKKIDLNRKCIATSPRERRASFYRKKAADAISLDPEATRLISSNKPQIAISIESLLDLVHLMHVPMSDMCMPLQVVAHPNGTQTLCFDHALPRQTVNARERNRLVFSVSFKSYITDINKKHSIIPSETVNEEEDEENLHYNLWTFGDLNILIRYQSDAELHDKEKQKPERVLLDTKVNYFDGELREIITPVERASNWFRSYIHGHANIIQGHINVPKHQVNSIETKTMSDIMSGDWQPHYETGVLLHLFTNLHRMLKPGHYLLRHEPNEPNLLIFQNTDKKGGSELNLSTLFKPLPDMGSAESCYVPYWPSGESEKDQIRWAFPPQ